MSRGSFYPLKKSQVIMTEQLELFNNHPEIKVGSKFTVRGGDKLAYCTVIDPQGVHFPCCWIETMSEFAWFDFNNKVMYMVLDLEVYSYNDLVWL